MMKGERIWNPWVPKYDGFPFDEFFSIGFSHPVSAKFPVFPRQQRDHAIPQ